MPTQPSVIAFSGHLTDSPSRATPRFPESLVPEVREKLRVALAAKRQPILSVSSAARGGDLLFIEQVLALGGSATVILPFPPDAFKRVSVGQGWDARFDELLAHERVSVLPPLHAALPAAQDQQDAAFAECNEHIAQRTRALSQRHGVSDPLFLAVYKKTSTDLTGGTLHAFEYWTKDGGLLEIVEP